MSKLRIAGIVRESIVDGDGIRFTLFTQGCPHHCVGCHNPDTHDFNGGYEIETHKILDEFKKNPLLSGITFSGGEPFCQAEALSCLAREIKELGKNIWVYSGYTYEELIDISKKDKYVDSLLHECDVLVDGKFEIEKKSMLLRFRGSKNQRIIDLKSSLNKENKSTPVIIEGDDGSLEEKYD